MLRLFKNLFRPPLLKKQLPLAPSSYSSDSSRGVVLPPGREEDIELLIGHGLAKRPEDAGRLLAAHPDWPVEQIIKECKRRRKHQGRVELARERARRLW